MSAKSIITHDEMKAELRKGVEQADTQGAYATELGVSVQYLNSVLNGTNPVSEKLALKLGYERILQEPVFKKLDKAAK